MSQEKTGVPGGSLDKKNPALQAGIELAGTLKIRWLTSWDFFLLEFVIKTLVLARKNI